MASGLVVPNAPTLAATPGDEEISVTITQPTYTGNTPIIRYEYKLDAGAWTLGVNHLGTMFTITPPNNQQPSYNVQVRAVNAAGASCPSAPVTVTPAALVMQEEDPEVLRLFTFGDPARGRSVQEAALPFTATVHPNPSASGETLLALSLTEATEVQVRLFDLQGRIVQQSRTTREAGAYTDRLPLPKPGVYAVEIATAHGMKTIKIVAQ
jgi:hypothetical protein